MPSPVVRGFVDTRKGPIPTTPAAPAWKGPVHPPKAEAGQQADALLEKFSRGVIRPDAARPDTLFAVGRSGRAQSLLAIFCRAAGARAHGFLAKVLLPAVEQLAQRIDVSRPAGKGDPIDWKRAAGGHLIAGADAALKANNPEALEAILPVALRLFPDDVVPFIESRLALDPAMAKTFAAAGVDPATLKVSLASANAPAGVHPPAGSASAVPAPLQASSPPSRPASAAAG